MKTVENLFDELSEKVNSPEQNPTSKTVAEFNAGVHAIGKKIVEEASEVWMAAEHEGNARTAEEISQLLYHIEVLMLKLGLTFEDINKNL